MGWGRTLFLGDIGNRLDIGDCEGDISRMKASLRQERYTNQSQEQEIAALRSENDEMKLYLAAVIRLLISKGVTGADEITRLVEAIDMEDGSKDGRMDGPLGQ